MGRRVLPGRGARDGHALPLSEYCDHVGDGKAAGPSGIVGSSGGTTTTTTTSSASGQIGDNFAVNLPISIDPYGAIGLYAREHREFLPALGVKLSAMEDSGMGKILSNPRIMTLNNGEAKISSGVKIPIQTVTTGTTTTSTAGSTSTTGIQTIEAFPRLTVTPQVTSDQRVLMKLETEGRAGLEPAGPGDSDDHLAQGEQHADGNGRGDDRHRRHPPAERVRSRTRRSRAVKIPLLGGSSGAT